MTKAAGSKRVVVGDAASYKKLFDEGRGLDAVPAEPGAAAQQRPPLAGDVAAFTKERALAQFSTDHLECVATRRCGAEMQCAAPAAARSRHRPTQQPVRGGPAGRAHAEGGRRRHVQGPQGKRAARRVQSSIIVAESAATQVRLWPGWEVDLSGAGGDLLYQVYRDTHAHA